MTDTTEESKAIIHAAPQQLVVRHAWLVERGLHSLPVLEITGAQVEKLCSALRDVNFDNRARALKTIAELGHHIKSRRYYLDSLIFPIVNDIYHYFGSEATVGHGYQLELFPFGQHYPPGAEYLELLRSALESLMGPVQSPDEAIMDVVCYGTAESRIRGIEWLADRHLTSGTHRTFSDYLDIFLVSTAEKTPLFLALKYADAKINDHVEEAIYFFIGEIIFENMPEELKTTAREYLVLLRWKASRKALISAFVKLAESHDSTDKKCALMLLYEVMERDLDEWSDDELEMISSFMGWLSDEQDEVKQYLDEYGERVMEELRSRGLHE